MNPTLTSDFINAGIYAIRHRESLKVYVGRSVLMRKRVLAHVRALRRQAHPNGYLQAAWLKYGEDAFDFVVLEVVTDEQTLPAREGHFCRALQAHDPAHGYNLDEVQEGGLTRFSEEHKRRISDSLQGHPVTEANREAMSEACRNKEWSAEERQKLSNAHTGKRHSDATKEKIRENGNKGRTFGPLSDAHKAKLSKARVGRSHTPEARHKMSEANKGRPKSEEQRLKMSKANKGKTRSPESIAKQAAALRGRARPKEASEKAAASNRGRVRTQEQRLRMVEGIRAAKAKKASRDEVPGETPLYVRSDA